MSETNGQSESRLDRLEASHIKLMTDHEVFWAHHQEFVAQQERAWARHDAWVAEQELAWERQKERDAALDARIEKLVSGIGSFIANANK